MLAKGEGEERVKGLGGRWHRSRGRGTGWVVKGATVCINLPEEFMSQCGSTCERIHARLDKIPIIYGLLVHTDLTHTRESAPNAHN